MTVKFTRSYPNEIPQIVLNPGTGHSSGWSPPREPKEASVGDDEDLARLASPPPSRWPRIFPSL
jgi:hypothetical protein